MSKKPTKLIGLRIDDFKSLVKEGKEIIIQPARLMPFHKPGDEMALTSIFLSALRLIREFRINIFKAINLSRGGTIQVFTEIEFRFYKGKRIDGLILVVKGKKIVDAVFVEVKNKNNIIEDEQIENYLDIARGYEVAKLLTISNQFVSFPTQSPVSIKTPKKISLFHLSWSHILTVAHILLGFAQK